MSFVITTQAQLLHKHSNFLRLLFADLDIRHRVKSCVRYADWLSCGKHHRQTSSCTRRRVPEKQVTVDPHYENEGQANQCLTGFRVS